jgi:aspartyl-tRNA(Asn)/glutamyl-tRNA(Gln) amidotransferase subunit A
MTELAFLSVGEAGALLASGEISAVELTEHHLARIEALDGRLHSFVHVAAERAREHARRAEREMRAGHRRGPLHGIPFGLKDNYDTAGIPTTANSAAFLHRRPDRDATVVRRIDEAGAILLGKHAMHELAYGGVSTELPWPVPRNPWNTERDTGGSSSGSGAAVAAGLAMFAMGTDTGGSVRNPAAHCGLVGLKPSFGLISRAGVMLNSYSLDHCGPLTRSVRDCALVMNAVVAHDPDDPASISRPDDVDYTAGLDDGIGGWTIGHVAHLYERDLPANDEVRVSMRTAIATLEALGANIEEVSIAPLEQYAACKATIQHPEIREEYEHVLRDGAGALGDKLRARLSIGRDISADDYLRAQRERRRLTRAMHALFGRCDLLVTAGPYAPAPLISEVAASRTFDAPEITVPFSLTSVPALSLCIGFTPSGLPLSMQMIGPHLGDHRVLRAAHGYQAATSWHNHHPPMSRSDVATQGDRKESRRGIQ